MYRWRLAAGIALCLALGAGLVVVLAFNRGDHKPTPATATPSARASPTPTPTPSPTPLAVPTPNTTGRDFERIYREIEAFHTWLYEHPDPKLLSLIYHPECECHALALRTLQRLRSEGLHFEGPAFLVDSVRVVEDFPVLVRIETRVRQPAQTLVTSDGRTVEEVPSEPPTVFNMALVQTGGRWVVRTITEIPS